MKYILYLLLLGFTPLLAQPDIDAKRDNSWVFGYGENIEHWGRAVFSFDIGVHCFLYNLELSTLHGTNTSISDTSGN